MNNEEMYGIPISDKIQFYFSREDLTIYYVAAK